MLFPQTGFRGPLCCNLIFVVFLLATPFLSGQEWNKSILIIETDSGQGSGFLLKDGDRTYVTTNAHVLAGSKSVKVVRIDGGEVALTPYIQLAADGRDLVRIPVREVMGLQPASGVRFGEPVAVLGNSGGARMVTQSRGEILAVGPDRIEVSAAFIQGNSGGPVLNAQHEVVGVATYVFRDAVPDWVAKNTRYARTRRVALRLNDIKWQLMNWFDFQREGELITRHQKFFEESVQRLSRAFESRDLNAVLEEKQGIRSFMSSFQRDFQNLRVAYFRNDLKEVGEGWEDLSGFLEKNFPGSSQSTKGKRPFAKAPNGSQWPKVDADRAAAYLKEKAIREREHHAALEANIRRGLQTGQVNNIPFRQALTRVKDFNTRKKYQEIAKRVSRELDASYAEALRLYGEGSSEGIEILKRRLTLEESMGYADRSLVTRAKLHALKVPGF